MSVTCQDRVRAISALVQSGQYEVDPVAVAEAMLRGTVLADLTGKGGAPPRVPRLRGLIRVRQLVAAPAAPRAA